MGPTPFEKGAEAFRKGGWPPDYPKPDMPWSQRLYYMGWQSEARKKEKSNQGTQE